MKPIRCFATLIAGISLLGVDGCNLILDNGSPDFEEGWDGTAGAPIAGAADGGQFGSSNNGGVALEENSAGSGGTAEVDVAGAGAGGTTAASKPVDNGSAVHDEEVGSSNGGSGAAPSGDSGAGGATEEQPGPLATPNGVTVTPTSETALTVTWGAVVGALAYEIELATDTNFSEKLSKTDSTTSTVFSGLNAGKRYYARVRATASQNPPSAWSSVVSGATLLNAPTPSLDLFVNTDVPIRYPGDVLWLEEPPNLPASGTGNYYYARGTASATCPPGTRAQYQFDAQYDNAPRKGYKPWLATNVAYITAPNSDSRITFYLKARCERPGEVNSAESAEIKSCRRRNNDPC